MRRGIVAVKRLLMESVQQSSGEVDARTGRQGPSGERAEAPGSALSEALLQAKQRGRLRGRTSWSQGPMRPAGEATLN